ncbi:MAG: hypothetical protein IKI68_01880, partial [Clostridia bacterium]|nr:hypothetical protein [Clostridia bacterium]
KYIEKLKNCNYTRMYKNTINENDFYTFSNGENIIHFYLINSLKTVKVIAEPFYDYSTFTEEKNVVKPAIIASSVCDRNFYVRLPDNTLVVIDGGWRIEDWSLYDHFKLLRETYEEMRDILGGAETVHIPLWFVTHAHTDHARMLEMLYQTDIKDKFVIDRILFNFPAENHIFDFPPLTEEKISEMSVNLQKWHNGAGRDFSYDRIFYNCPFPLYDDPRYDLKCRGFFKEYSAVKIKAHDGMKFSLSGVDFEVLHTPDDDMPTIFETINDTSVIVKMTYRNSSMLWLGDMGPVPSDSCVQMYGKELKCDAMQVAHHGWGAATPEFYEMSKPSVLFWNNSEFGFKYADKYQGFGKTKTSTDLYNMDCVKKNIFCNRIRPTYAFLPIKIPDTKTEKSDCIIALSAVSDRIIMMRLPDGKLVMFDGGWRKEDWDNYEHKALLNKLYDEMCALAKNENITVALWAFSNAFAHNTMLLENLKTCDFAEKVKVEKIVCGSFDTMNAYDSDFVPDNHKEELLSALSSTGAEIIIAKDGDRILLGDVTVKILYSGGQSVKTAADSFVVYRIEYNGSSFVYTGEMTDDISKILIEKYGDDLKCDVVQIANHGWNNGGVAKFYEKCAARLQLWNNSEYGYRFFKENEGYKKSPSSTRVFGLTTCKLNAFCDQCKPQYFSFPIRDDELEYDV